MSKNTFIPFLASWWSLSAPGSKFREPPDAITTNRGASQDRTSIWSKWLRRKCIWLLPQWYCLKIFNLSYDWWINWLSSEEQTRTEESALTSDGLGNAWCHIFIHHLIIWNMQSFHLKLLRLRLHSPTLEKTIQDHVFVYHMTCLMSHYHMIYCTSIGLAFVVFCQSKNTWMKAPPHDDPLNKQRHIFSPWPWSGLIGTSWQI